MGKGRVIEAPPFPTLHWDEYFWTAKYVLPSWAGFQSRFGSYGAISSAQGSTGLVQLHVGGEGADEEEPPTPEMRAAFDFLMKNEKTIAEAVLDAVFKAYPEEKAKYGYAEEEAQELMPDLKSPEELKRLIGIHTVHFLKAAADGVGCVGFEFGCTWDEEHGLGVITHKTVVMEVGGADTAFLEWVAERGLESQTE